MTLVSNSMVPRLKAVTDCADAKIRVVPNGVYASSVDRHSEFSHRLLVVGSLIERKRVDVAISALALLPLEWKLTVVGGGPQSASLEMQCASLALDDRVDFRGEVPPDELREIYCNHDILIHCARAEGRPNVVVEAFASGLPVIAADVDGAREIVTESGAGVLVGVGNVVALARAIEAVADGEVYQQLAQAGPNWIRDRGLTWNGCALAYEKIFEELLT